MNFFNFLDKNILFLEFQCQLQRKKLEIKFIFFMTLKYYLLRKKSDYKTEILKNSFEVVGFEVNLRKLNFFIFLALY